MWSIAVDGGKDEVSSRGVHFSDRGIRESTSDNCVGAFLFELCGVW